MKDRAVPTIRLGGQWCFNLRVSSVKAVGFCMLLLSLGIGHGPFTQAAS